MYNTLSYGGSSNLSLMIRPLFLSNALLTHVHMLEAILQMDKLSECRVKPVRQREHFCF